METKQQVTTKLIWGAGLIVLSLVLGKLVLVPIFLFPMHEGWRMAMIYIYALSWVLLLIGMVIAGVEGYKLGMRRYKVIRKKSLQTVRRTSVKTVRTGVKTVRTVGRTGVKAARKVKETSKKAVRKVRRK
ncbi:hypothetical protein ACFL0V_06015 [Nanoarchaeota archaeon]